LRPWIVINTQPHRECLAQENLARPEFEVYCPVVRKRRSHARRMDVVLRPLFPSYLFVRTDPERHRWRPILSTLGVRSIVRAGQDLSFIEDAFIVGLKQREVDGAIVKPSSPYQVGQRVALGGPFDGLVATIVALDEKERITVLLDILQRPTRVRLGSEHVTPA
jgi:transcriptional antiterminator RfaH